jgi:hypothetical protein
MVYRDAGVRTFKAMHSVVVWVDGDGQIETRYGSFKPQPGDAFECQSDREWSIATQGAAFGYLTELTHLSI